MLAIRKAQELGFEPILITKRRDMYRGLGEFSIKVVDLDTNCYNTLQEYVDQENVEDIAGIMTTSDYYLQTVAKLNESFSLTGNGLDAITLCRNKAFFRERMSAFSKAQPEYIIIRNEEDIHYLEKSFQLPCVVKPADDSGSNNVKLCRTWEEVKELSTQILGRATNIRGQPTARMVLLEEYIDGPEYSVETFTWQGNTVCIGITEKRVTGNPFFVEVGHIFRASLSSDIQLQIEETVTRALKEVNFKYGAAHTEVKWTKNGCVIIEVNPRLAGGMIPELIRYTTGIDLLHQQILHSVGIEPSINKITQRGHAGIHFIVSSQSGILVDVEGLDSVKNIPGVVQVEITAKIGQNVHLPKNFSHRLGYVIVLGETYDHVNSQLREVAESIVVQVKSQNL